MVIEYIRYSVEEDRADAFEQAYRRASARSTNPSTANGMRSRAVARIRISMSFGSSGIPRKGTCPDSDRRGVSELPRRGRPVR